jgi:hypothetical protein
LLPATPVIAGDSVSVTVTMQFVFTAGITSFNITYVSDTQLDLNWTVDPTVDNVMIRAKYGSYTADIPNDTTTPSDGYLVYYGPALSASDTSMNFNENPGSLFYKAWAQKADTTWYTQTSSGFKESRELQLLFLGLITLGATGLAFGFKQDWLKMLSAVLWFVVGYFAYITFSLVNGLQWVFLIIGFAFTVCLMIVTIHGMALNSEAKRTALVTKRKLAADTYFGDEEVDDEDVRIENERKYYEKQWQPTRTKRSKRRSQLLR